MNHPNEAAQMDSLRAMIDTIKKRPKQQFDDTEMPKRWTMVVDPRAARTLRERARRAEV